MVPSDGRLPTSPDRKQRHGEATTFRYACCFVAVGLGGTLNLRGRSAEEDGQMFLLRGKSKGSAGRTHVGRRRPAQRRMAVDELEERIALTTLPAGFAETTLEAA